MVFGGKAFGRYLDLHEVMKVDLPHAEINVFVRGRDQRPPLHSRAKRYPSANQEGSHQALDLWCPVSGTVTYVCHLSHLACGFPLLQFEQTETNVP